MKKTTILTLFIAFLTIMQSCQQDPIENPTSEASISVETTTDENGFQIVKLIPNDKTVRVDYALAPDGSIEKFENGEMGIMSNEGNATIEITTDDLTPRCYYTIVAKAYDKNEKASPASIITVSTYPNDLRIENSYLTESTAGFVIYCSGDYQYVNYYLGVESDRENFQTNNGLVDGQAAIMEYYGANYFDLEAGKDYVFFIKGLDRNGNPVFKDLSIKTYSSKEECPSAEFEIISSNAYNTVFKINTSNKTSKVAAFAHNLQADQTSTTVMYGNANGRGNLVSVFSGWIEIGFNFQTSNEKTFEYTVTNELFSTDIPVDLYIATMDETGNISGIYKKNLTIAEFDENAGDATCEIEIKDITSTGATYTFTPGENTMAVFYETVEGDWFDDFSQTSDYNEFYMHNRFFNGEGFFMYGKESFEMKEVTATPDTKYYAMACPMNNNGLNGWGKLEMKEYRTTK